MDTKSPFTKIANQLDQIPKDVSVAFLCYSCDSEEHQELVPRLSADLREKFRVYTLLDKYSL